MSSRAFSGILQGDDGGALLRVQLALANLPQKIAWAIADAAGAQLSPGWGDELTKGGQFSSTQRRILTAEQQVLTHPLGMTVSAGSTKRIRGSDGRRQGIARFYEFGSLQRDAYTKYRRRNRRNAGTHQVERRATRQIPSRSQTGWIIYPAASRLGKRVFQMFLQIVVKYSHEAVEAGDRS